MATRGSTRDVKLTLSVETLGEDGIRSLRQTLSDLAKQGGAAAPEFERLANEIDRISQQADALETFRELGAETGRLATQQTEARAAVERLDAELTAAGEAARQAAAKQREANTAFTEAKNAVLGARNEIAQLKIDTDVADRANDNYRATLSRLNQALLDARQRQNEVAQSRSDAALAATRAEAAEAKLESAYSRAAATLSAANRAVEASQAATERAAQDAQALGVATENVAEAQAGLIAALNSTGSAAQRLQAEVNDLAESDRLLAIEQRGMADLFARGAAALNQEVLALADASQNTREYAAALAQAKASQDAWQAEAEQLVDAAENVQRLSREAQILAAVERELAAQRVFEQKAADARKLVQAAEYVRFWETELQRAEAQAQQTANAAAAAAKRIDDAFKTVGVQSVEQLRLEIANVRAAMAILAAQASTTGQSFSGAFAAGEAKIRAAELQIRELNGTLTVGDRLSKLFANSMGQIAAGNIVADAVGYLVNKVKELGREFIMAIVQLDQMRRGLNAIYGDAGTVASQILFLRRTATDAGVSFGGLSKEFVKFSASMQGANIPLSESNALFAAVVRSSATLGLSAEETAGSLNALSQMASKGVVSMEELRQQLGDRLPGAFGLVAKGLGITEAELVKLVESGNLAARDLFPALTSALNAMRGETDGLVPTFERLKGALTEIAQGMGDAGYAEVLIGVLKALGVIVGSLAMGFSVITEAIGFFTRSIGVLAGAVVTATNPLSALRDLLEQARQRLTGQATALQTVVLGTDAVTASTRNAAVATSQYVTAATAAVNAADATAKAAQLQALADQLAADKTLDKAAAHVQFSNAAAQALAVQQKQTEASDKLAKAAKIEGDSLIALAKLRGDEQGQIDAAAAAATKYSAALEVSAKNHQAELDILLVMRKELVENNAARGANAEAIKAQVAEKDKAIIKAQAETEQSRQAAEAARIEVQERRLSAQIYRDNSARVDEYRAALTAATQALQVANQLAATGNATDREVAAAKERVAFAQRLYNDALTDSIGKLQLETQAKAANAQIQISEYNVRAQTATLLANSARLLGDNATALYYELEAKRAQIEATRLAYQIKGLEAQADIKALEIKKLTIPLDDAMREQKLQELEIRIKLAQAKLAEAGAGDELVRAMERELQAMRVNGAQRTTGTTGIDRDTDSRLRNATAIDRQTDALTRQRGLTSDGFETNADGSAKGSFNNGLPTDQARAALDAQRSGRPFTGDPQAALSQAQQALNDLTALSRLSPGSVSPQALNDAEAMLRAATVFAQQATAGKMTADGKPAGQYVVAVSINGVKQAPITTASQQDADNLSSVLKNLEKSSISAARI